MAKHGDRHCVRCGGPGSLFDGGAFITDAATGKAFLFVPPAKAGGKPAAFELSHRPEPFEHDPTVVPLPPLEEPHRTALHHARVLVALKKIKGELAARSGEK